MITTLRLILRPFRDEDAPDIQRLAGSYEVAYNTLLIPHPYPDGAAEVWIKKQREHESDLAFAITEKDTGALTGALGLHIVREHDRGEIGYWIGLPYWNRGYATEAVGAVIQFGFEHMMLHRIWAGHFTRNIASGRVMQKNGMKHEGCWRGWTKKWNEFLDVEMYSILRDEYMK